MVNRPRPPSSPPSSAPSHPPSRPAPRLKSQPKSRQLAPLGVALLTLAISVALFISDKSSETNRLTTETRIASANYAARLESHLMARLETTELLAQHFQRGTELDNAEFQSEAELFHKIFSDIQALNWIDPDGIIRVVTPLSGNEPALGLDLKSVPIPAAALQQADERNRLQITPPIQLAQGGMGLSAYVPMTAEGQRVGFLNLVFRPVSLVGNALAGTQSGSYAIRVMDGDKTLFASQMPVMADAPTARTTIQVAQRRWQILVSPTPTLIREMSSNFGVLFLLFGAILAVLTGVLCQLVMDRQAKFAASQERFQDFANASSDWFWETDRELRISWLSDGIESFFDRPRKTLLGNHPWEFQKEKDNPDAFRKNVALLQARRPFKDLDFMVPLENEVRWMRVSAVPRFDRNGRFLGYRGTASNITEQMHDRLQAQQADQLLANAVEGGSELFSLWDSDDRLVLANRKFRTLHRDISDAIVPGTPYKTFLRAAIRAGYIPACTDHEDEFIADRLAQRAAPAGTSTEVMRDDGTILQLRDQRLNGGAIVTIAEDVTEQRRYEEALRASQERYELAVQQTSIWDWDLRTDKLYTSAGFARSLGYSNEEFNLLKHASVANLVHPEDEESYLEKLRAHIDDPGQIFSNEHRFRTKSGDYRWFLARGQATADKTGVAVRSTGVLTDITERIELEEQLHQAQKMEAIGQLTGGVAHDFNNLLTVILGNAELIGEIGKDERLTPLIAAISHASDRGAELTQRLLAFSRRQPLRPTNVDMHALLGELPSLLSPVLGETLELQLRCAEDMWHALADPGQIENALLNIALNARDAMPSGGTLSIDCYNTHFDQDRTGKDLTISAGDYVVICISDTGTGMSEDTLTHAYEPFFTTKGVGKGSGLGLSMVHGFAQQSGGQVSITSSEGRGTTVKLYLPATAPQCAFALPSTTGTPPTGQGEVILLLEDNQALRKLTSEMLARLGYQVHAAEHAKAARQIMANQPDISLILSDVVLPGGTSGPAYVTEVLAQQPEMKVIYMSGYPSAVLASDGALSPDCQLLAKPFKIAQLAKALDTTLRGDPLSG